MHTAAMLRALILCAAACAPAAAPPPVLQASAPPVPARPLIYARVGDRGPVIEIAVDGPEAAARAMCELLVRRSGDGAVRPCGHDRLPPRAPAIELVDRSRVTPADLMIELMNAHAEPETLDGASATVDARTPFPDRAHCELALAAQRDERAREASTMAEAMREMMARGLSHSRNERDERCGKVGEVAKRCATIAEPHERKPCEVLRDELIRQCAESKAKVAELEESSARPRPPAPDRTELRCIVPAAPR